MVGNCQFRLIILLCFTFSGLMVSAAEGESVLPDDKINLALRRTADRLLRQSGDSTSRIPEIEKVGEGRWRVQLDQPFNYDLLPGILSASLSMHDITQAYDVYVRRCEDAAIQLGFHRDEWIQDSVVACAGRDETTGCQFIEIHFLQEKAESDPWLSRSIIFFLAISSGAGMWFLFRKNGASAENLDISGDWISFGGSRLHPGKQTLISPNKTQQLTYREAKLLHVLATHPNELMEREQIIQQVWADEGVQVSRSVDVFISRLRKKLAADPSVRIVAVHGVGYKFETGI